MGRDVRKGQTSTANTGALPADVSTAMHFCQSRTNYKLQRIENRKLNTNEKKTQLASTKKKICMKNLIKTGERYVNEKLANVWGKKFKTTQGKRRIFRDLGMEELTHLKRP